jgi:hypothetical protein
MQAVDMLREADHFGSSHVTVDGERQLPPLGRRVPCCARSLHLLM